MVYEKKKVTKIEEDEFGNIVEEQKIEDEFLCPKSDFMVLIMLVCLGLILSKSEPDFISVELCNFAPRYIKLIFINNSSFCYYKYVI